jgi:hypothetical protein
VIPFTNLQSGVETAIHGECEEFEATHIITDQSSIVNLTWVHEPGTELNRTASIFHENDELPYFWEFCYFTIAFEWIYDEIPNDALLTTTFQTDTTGDFLTVNGTRMFQIHSWLIDSSGEWTNIFSSEPPYSSVGLRYTSDLNFFDLHGGWEGMVTDENGAQEDPTDILRVGIGLAPTEYFDSFMGTHPWQEYDGSVTIIVSSVSLVVEMIDHIAIRNIQLITGATTIFSVSLIVVAIALKLRRK